MALPAGPLKSCERPNRRFARRFSAKDVARIYCKAVQQGVTHESIRKELEQRCKPRDTDCDCARLLSELKQAQMVAELALELVAVLVPALRALKALRKIIDVLRAMEALKKVKQIEDMNKETPRIEDINDLENKAGNAKTILEGEYQRVVEEQQAVAESMADIRIRP